MYVRKEAVLSSQIEGTQSSLQDVLAAEAQILSPEPTENTLKSIVRWDPIFEGKELSKPIELGVSVAFNVYPPFCIATSKRKEQEKSSRSGEGLHHDLNIGP